MRGKDYPQYSNDAILGDKGRRVVENILHDSFGWMFREISKDDLGIDGLVEVLEEDRRSRGRLFAVQIKCGHSYLTETTDSGYVFRGKESHLNYWLEFSLPVVLIVCNPDTGDCYWVEVTAANVNRTGSGWKVVVPFEQTLTPPMKSRLSIVVRSPQPNDLIPLALYRLLVEKFSNIVIAQVLEEPHDFWGFEFLAELGEDLVLITYLYKPTERFARADIDDILQRREVCSKLCGWDASGRMPKVVLFFVAHTVEQLQLDPDVLAYMSQYRYISHYRAICSFAYGVSLTEVDANGGYIDIYERPRGK